MIETVQVFCRQVRARSNENQKALITLIKSKSYGVATGLLRQELDSLIRMAYIDRLGMRSVAATNLIRNSVDGKSWEKVTSKGKVRRITDREMLELASELGGWELIVYSFGCRLIHLSNLHDYIENDPFLSLPAEEQSLIIDYLKSYHNFPYADIDFDRFIEYLPKVMQKIVENVLYYVSELEAEFLSKD